MSEFWNRIPPLARVPLRYGIIGGGLGFVTVIALYYIGKHPFLIYPLFDFRVLLFTAFIVFILKEIRDDHFGGMLFFWQGAIASGIFVFTYGLIASLLMWVFEINVPEFVSKYIELKTNELKALDPELIKQMGKDVYEKNLALLPGTTAFQLASLYFVQCLGIGFFISMIISVILRRQPTNLN